MSIYERSNGYQIKIQVKGRVHREQFSGTRGEAEVREALIKASLSQSLPIPDIGATSSSTPSTTLSLRELLDRTEKKYWRKAKSGKELYRSGEVVAEFLGADRPADTISDDDVDDLIDHLDGLGNRDGTINRKLAALSRMMRFAHKRGWISRVPLIERRKEAPGRIRYLSYDEEDQILQYFRDTGDRDLEHLTIIGLDTGMRVSEILEQPTKDIIFETNQISIWKNKGNLPRSVPMTGRVRKVMEDRIKKGAVHSLFRLKYKEVHKSWHNMRKTVGLSDDWQTTFHVTRHTCASRLVQRGAPIQVVQKYLGHKTLIMTLRYAHLSPVQLAEAASLLETRPEIVTFPVTFRDVS